GIRDFHVTGVQTCALPISTSSASNEGESPHGKRQVSPVASIFRRLAAAVAAVLLAVGGYQAYRYYHRLVPVGDRRIDPRAEIDPRPGYPLELGRARVGDERW